MSLIWPWMLLTLLLVPLFIGTYFRFLQQRRQTTAKLGPLGIIQTGAGYIPRSHRHVPPIFYLFGVTLLLVGLARPEMPVSLPRVEGIVILAFDLSNSMLADDIEPTRLEAAKEAARAFVENQPNTVQIGVVAFGNGGLVVVPPTDNQADIQAAIERLNPQGGTSLSQGIFTSLNAIAGEPITINETAFETGQFDASAFQIDDYSSAVVVLLTDGENTEPPEPLEVAQVAAEAGVRIFPIGIGSLEGAIMEIDGFNIVTRLNESALQDIADLTNGSYYHVEDEESLKEVYQNIDLQLTIKGEKMEVTSIFAGISALLLLIGGLLSMLWFGRIP